MSHDPPLPTATFAAGYVQRLAEVLAGLDLAAVGRVAERLRHARDQGAMVYIAGNGGSAATAAHWANDLGKATKRSGRAPFRVLSMGDNAAWLTALANDEGYERGVAGQLENFVSVGDVLVAISASGNSANLVSAVELVRSRGATAIGFLGFDGGALLTLVDDAVWLRTERGAYELVEDAHAVLCHILTQLLAQDHPTPSAATARFSR